MEEGRERWRDRGRGSREGEKERGKTKISIITYKECILVMCKEELTVVAQPLGGVGLCIDKLPHDFNFSCCTMNQFQSLM